MKKKATLIGLFAIFLAACRPGGNAQSDTGAESTDSTAVDGQVPDSTLWGHLGEDTGMSVLQFVTNEGDTLELYRTSPYTGEDGVLSGDIRNYTDLFAVTVDQGSETMLTAINVTQLVQKWNTPDGPVELCSDGSIVSKQSYSGWRLWNGHLLLSSQVQQEYGTATRQDTVEIAELSDDSLIIRNHINQIIRFGK